MILPDAIIASSRFFMMTVLGYTKLGNPFSVLTPIHPYIIAITPKLPHIVLIITYIAFTFELVS